MHHRLYLPIMENQITEETRAEYATLMREIGVDTVFIGFEYIMFLPEHVRHEVFCRARDNVDYFRSNGFEVGIWITTFGFGGPMSPEEQAEMGEGGQIVSSKGISGGRAFCPENETFMEACLRSTKEIVEIIHPDLLMLDDEMCLSVRPGIGCFCDEHMRRYREAFGEEFTRDELVQKIFCGKNDRYRRGWLEIVGNSMRKFCQRMRSAVDEVDPTQRLGFCAGFTSFDIEGADAFELSLILAGKTKPFLRLSGAPYWSSHEFKRFSWMRMNAVIDFVRIQEKWGRDFGMELFHEDDSYPRPRYRIPANPTESYDIALRASGGMGSFKYLFSYERAPSYEMGYYKRHARNMQFYRHIEENYDNKRNIGVHVYERMHRLADMTFPDAFEGEYSGYETKVMSSAFSYAANLLSLHGIPTTYEGNTDCGIAFGVGALEIGDLPKKLILDRPAAQILEKRGVDVGLMHHTDKADYYEYDNGNTKFLVFSYNAYDRGWDSIFSGDAMLGYDIQDLLWNFIGRSYPRIEHQPSVYSVCKTDGGETAVMFVNLCDDDWFDFDVLLDREYDTVALFGAEGIVNGRTIHIDGSVPAWGALSVILK